MNLPPFVADFEANNELSDALIPRNVEWKYTLIKVGVNEFKVVATHNYTYIEVK